jgi:hypothetical protein
LSCDWRPLSYTRKIYSVTQLGRVQTFRRLALYIKSVEILAKNGVNVKVTILILQWHMA